MLNRDCLEELLPKQILSRSSHRNGYWIPKPELLKNALNRICHQRYINALSNGIQMLHVHVAKENLVEELQVIQDFNQITHFTLHCHRIRVGLGIPQITQA